MCIRDSYWTDPFKLQKQVDFLEANNDYGLVHHEADYFFQINGKLIRNHHRTNRIRISDGFVFEELLRNNNIYTPTVMFKTCLFEHFLAIDENVRNKFLMGDYVMWLEFSQHCKFHYLPQSMSTYRVLENSMSKSTSYEKTILFLNSYFNIRLFFLKKHPLKNITIEIIEQWRISSCINCAIMYKKNKEALHFASNLKINKWGNLVRRVLVHIPILFRFILKRKKS